MKLSTHGLISKILLIVGSSTSMLIWFLLLSFTIQSTRSCETQGFDIFCGEQWAITDTLLFGITVAILVTTLFCAVVTSVYKYKAEAALWRLLVVLSSVQSGFCLILLVPTIFDIEAVQENAVFIINAILVFMGTIATATFYRRIRANSFI